MTKPKQTKIAKVQAMLRRPSGASIDALSKAKGWQAHSVRAALTGLRTSGLDIQRQEADAKTDKAVYRIVVAADASA